MSEQQKIIRNYERKKELWISSNDNADYIDMKLQLDYLLEIHIVEDILEIDNPEKKKIFYNGKQTVKSKMKIKRGDSISFLEYKITFFEDWLEVEGDFKKEDIRLLEVAGEQEKFSGFPYYKRSPRVIYRRKKEKIAVKAPPAKKEMVKGGVLQMLIPTFSTLSLTVVMGILLKRGPYVYMSIGMTIITTIFSVKRFIEQKKEVKEANEKREVVYRNYLLKKRKQIRDELRKEKQALHYQYPDAKTIERMIRLYSSRLYERSFMDGDFLQITLGYYKGLSDIQVTYEKDELEIEKDELKDLAKELYKEYGKLEHIPLTVELRKTHLGLVGSKKNIHEQLKSILLQLTFFQSYHDLQIIFLHHEAYKEDFSYIHWYPHLHIQAINVNGQIYTDQVRDQILGSIQQILKERKQKVEEDSQEVIFPLHILFVIDEPRFILNHPLMEYLQSKEMNLGFSFIYTSDQQENLPENIKTLCILENAEDGRLLLNEGERVNQRFQLQDVSTIELEEVSRNLSAIVHETGMNSQIPEAITFFEMYGIEHPEQLQVRERWRRNQSHKTLAVPLGVRAKEDYVELNLHEKAHGPHGLVAGTTGSGKSEIVQSYILSLAVNFHPHEVGFLLIDYKGGGMANLFADLPHLLGTITNLDKAESMRAMASIKSELARRQQIFGEHNVNHINGYNKLFKLGQVSEPLPHLFIISDEFAELKKEQPEFMSELVSAARIGRSLGIHLILATQKPSGVVDDQIWTNSKFKLCLKVQNEGDSKEMLKTPDAANITQPGRSYLQVGNNEIYELFQSAWSGAAYQKEQTEEEKEDDRVYLVNQMGQGELINQDLSGPKESNQIKATQLDVVVSHIREIYEQEHAVEVKKPWLPSLLDMLLSPYTREVRDSKSYTDLDLSLGLGIIDIPEEQAQREYILDFERQGHLLYMASSGYGKSILLGHIILGLAMKNSVKNFKIYIMDLGNSALISYKALPHVADYMSVDDTEKIGKFQKMILELIRQRKKQLAKAMAQNFSVYNQTQKGTLQAILIVVDNYDVVSELGDDVITFLQKAARDGAGLGIYLAVTLTRENVMRGATKGNFKERIAGFNFVDGENNSFIGRSQIRLPEDKKGRVLIKQDSINLMQLYTPVNCDNELQYNEELQILVREVAEKSTEERAKGIPTLPEVLYYEILSQYPVYEEMNSKVPVGIDVDTLEVKYLDLLEGPGLILGGAGTGKTNTVKTLLKMAEAGGIKTYIFDGEDGILQLYKEQAGVCYANTKEAILDGMRAIEAFVNERRELYEEARIEDVTLGLKEFGRNLEPIYIIVDSIQEVLTITDEKSSLNLLEIAVKYGIFVLVTSDNKLRKTTGCDFINILRDSTESLILGSLKDQSLVSSMGIREDNKNLEIGYYHKRGEIRKIKLIENK
jgi:S-DNA-T family DNA segregation ATPase FtsK/SpoIIIE